jgi:hypothetical protein
MSRPKKYSNVLFTVDCSECETAAVDPDKPFEF